MENFQYPDTIEVTRNPVYTQDEDGYFESEEGEKTLVFTSECRAEPAGSNPVIRGIDGNEIIYVWIVYLPLTSETFEFGLKVKVTKLDGSVYEGSLKRFYNGKFNTRIWV